MSKITLKPGTLLAPLPAVLVTCGTIEKANALTIAWTGIINTIPPMTYISVRPERHSYPIIKETGEFVINLTTSAMARETDFCGVRSGREMNKIEKCKLTLTEGKTVSAPVIEQSPLSLECKVREIKELGSHHMFIAEITGIQAEERYMDSKGKLNLQQSGLMAYSHGEYFALGRKLGDFGFSVRKKSKISSKISPKRKDGKK